MTLEILNPVSLPEDLNPAEKRLAQCLKEGQPCIVGDGSRPEKRVETGRGCNVIRERVLCFFIFGGDEEHPTRGPAIELYGAYIPREEYIIDIHFTRIPYGLIFSNCLFTGKMHLIGVECAELDLAGSRLEEGLIATGLKTTGSVFLSRDPSLGNAGHEFYAGQEVRLSGASIGGNLDCGGGEFHNPDGDALAADRLMVGGHVLLRNDFSAEGEVRLSGTNIGGNLDCSAGSLSSSYDRALIADGITTKGDVFFRRDFSTEGEVRLSGANIGGELICVSGKIHNQNGPALSADGLTIHGSISLSENLSIIGDVRFSGANIHGGLLWKNIEHKQGSVDLSYTKTSVLKDDISSWESSKVDLRGFSYDYFDNFENAEFRIKWLENRPKNISFSPLPYEQAAKTLFGMGHIDDAQKILLKMERLQTSDLHFGLRKIGRWIWDGLAGYGYRWRRTVYEMLGIVIVGAVLFSCADESKRMVPHQPAVLSNAEYQKMAVAQDANPKAIVAELFPEYPEFNALLYSVDVFIPFFALHQEPYWYPKPSREDPFWIRYLLIWYWIEIAAGWVLTSLLLLSITGLLRPRQESAGKG